MSIFSWLFPKKPEPEQEPEQEPTPTMMYQVLMDEWRIYTVEADSPEAAAYEIFVNERPLSKKASVYELHHVGDYTADMTVEVKAGA